MIDELPEMHPCCLALFNRIYSTFAEDQIRQHPDTDRLQAIDPFALCLAWEVVENVPALPDEVREHASSTLASTVEGFADALKAAHEKDPSPIELV